MQNPNNSGSMYLNYKGTFSIVLMAVCDANYCYIFADTGIQGRILDGGAFRETTSFKKLEKNKLNLPTPEPLPGRQVGQPYVILGDDAFALSEQLMKPFPGLQLDKESKTYNYRLSRARRIVKNTFGLMCSVFRVLKTVTLKCRKRRSCYARMLLSAQFFEKK